VLAVIVAGGLGTRARAMTGDDLPKALLPVGGAPILEHQMRVLAAHGVTRLVILAGYLGGVIESYLREHPPAGLEVSVRTEAAVLGTAGAVIDARESLGAEDLLVIFGDLLFNLDFARLAADHRASGAAATIVCRPNDHPVTSDLVEVDDAGRITALLPRKGRAPGDYRNLVPSGIYMLARRDMDGFPRGEKLDFFQDYFPALHARGGVLQAHRSTGYMCDIGTPEGRAAAERDLVSGRFDRLGPGKPRPAIFFDVDGVLNEEVPGMGILAPDEVRLVPGAGAALRAANHAGVLAVAATNRPQLAKGQVTRAQLERIFGRLETGLAGEGGFLDRLYFCPHHPERGFAGEVAALKTDCDCRKPHAGMLLRAMRELPVDCARSAMIGDTWRDIAAARAAGVYAYGARTGYGVRELRPGLRPDLMFTDIAAATTFCLNYAALAAPLVERIESLCAGGSRVLVGLCGHSQAGKSNLAHALERIWREHGRPVLRVHLDDWLMTLAERGDQDVYLRARAACYVELYRGLRAGETVTAPGYDPVTRGPAPPMPYAAPPGALVLIDGVLACSDPGRAHLDLAVLVHRGAADLVARQRALLCWKGLGEVELAATLEERGGREAATIEAQRGAVDIVFEPPELVP
jgi:histidinol-phosphate phosphatase family protein